MTTLIFDTETTGIDEPEIVQAAWIELSDVQSLEVINAFDGNFKPSKPIALGALAIHHIMDEELADCPPSDSFKLPEGTEYLIGHNIDFDWNAIGKPDVKRIDTLALCRMIWPEIESHTQSAMLYHLERNTAREQLKNAHSAAADVQICRTILIWIADLVGATHGTDGKLVNWEQLWEASEMARVPERMPFGKHKGVHMRDVPADYKRWLLRQPDVDPYLVKALTQ